MLAPITASPCTTPSTCSMRAISGVGITVHRKNPSSFFENQPMRAPSPAATLPPGAQYQRYTPSHSAGGATMDCPSSLASGRLSVKTSAGSSTP